MCGSGHNRSGARVFLKARIDCIEAAISAAGDAPLSLYEVVDGMGVRPFFDLEYATACNMQRSPHLNAQLVAAIVAEADKWLLQQCGKNVRVDHVVVLDSSNSAKFSMHVILHLQQRAALATIKDAKRLAEVVVGSLPPSLVRAHAPSGDMVSILDCHVYKRNQQFRLMGCVKFGNDRMLRLHELSTVATPSLQSTYQLFALADEPTALSKPAQGLADGTAAVALPQLVQHLAAALGCCFYNVQLHTQQGHNSPSLFVHTNSTACAQRQHVSNHVVVEVCCDRLAWRLLCRDRCNPSPWHDLLPEHLVCAPGAPVWLTQHLRKWCKQL